MPQPDPEQVLIRVRAVSLNSRDVQILSGRYPSPFSFPIVPVSDGVGEVVAVGTAVKRVKVGDRVAGIFRQKWMAGKPTVAIRQSTLGCRDCEKQHLSALRSTSHACSQFLHAPGGRCPLCCPSSPTDLVCA